MEDTFDPSKEGRRVISHYGQANTRQVSEDRQREEESAARSGRASVQSEKGA